MTERGPLNVLYHHRTQGTGVERVHIMGVVDAWRKRGHRVDIVSPPGVDPDNPAPVPGSTRSMSLGWLARRVPRVCFEFMEIVYNLFAVGSLWRRHRRCRYDLVYERYAYLNLAGLLTSRLAGVPFVLEVNFTSATVMARQRSRAARFLERKAERFLFPRAHACVVVSSRLRSLLVETGVDERRILVQPNAADPAKFDPRRRAEALGASLGLDGRLVVGFLGRFHAWHGVQLLFDAIDAINAAVPAAAYLLVGDGPTHAGIQESVHTRGWEQMVRLPGSIPHDAVAEYVALFDVAVMPDSNDYGSPMKIAEYMAAGKAVVAPRLGPIEEMVDDGRTGVLFDPGSGPALVFAIVGLLSDSARRADIGLAARRHVEQTLNWDTAAERVLDLAERTSGRPARVSHPSNGPGTSGPGRPDHTAGTGLSVT